MYSRSTSERLGLNMQTAIDLPPIVARIPVISLVGLPNAGKTSLYNLLTGSNQKTMNYPGSTVSYTASNSSLTKQDFQVIDTPGITSLNSCSPEECLTMRLLTQLNELMGGEATTPDLLLCVVDGTQFPRHMALVRQLQRANFPIAIAVSKKDLMEKEGHRLNIGQLSKDLSVPVFVFNGQNGEGAQEILSFLDSYEPLKEQVFPVLNTSIDGIHNDYLWADQYTQFQVDQQENEKRDWDEWILHPVMGPIIFASIMCAFFFLIFFAAAPMMEGVEILFDKAISLIHQTLPAHWVTSWIANGLVAGIGAVLVFVPQIVLLFIALGIMEQSGYLARGAVMVDRPLSLLGMNGKSFVPLLSGCACAIPAMMAARSIQCKRERLVTLFVIPLMTCSARLPVYGLLLTLLLGNSSPMTTAIWMTGIYFLSFSLASIVAAVFSRFSFLPKKENSEFQIELPPWKRPNFQRICRSAFRQTLNFLKGAGPTIVTLSVVLWILGAFPNEENSYASMIGKWMDPVLYPMGIDWRVGVALLLAFAAREVFVSALVVAFAASGGDGGLLESLQGAVFAGSNQPVFTFSSILGLIVFFMIAMQCIATVAVARKELGGWKWPAIMTITYTLMAYVLSVTTVQGLRLLGFE
ncbi:MAG: ferrous iron transport protein B [Chlamydiales bacterium]